MGKITEYTVACRNVEIVEAPKCEHKGGQWVVVYKNTLRLFDPPTQLQKDIWLSVAKTEKTREARLAALRWRCHTCGTVQVP